MLCTRESPVAPTGPPSALIAVVGQAPGSCENGSGTCFVGPAGQLLKELLCAFAYLDPQQVYYTNAVKCYPGKSKDADGKAKGDRLPSQEEQDACREQWLSGELHEIEAKAILALGEVASSCVGKVFGVDVDLKSGHGESIEVSDGRILVPLHHPAARTRSLVSLVRDLKKLRTIG